jgi:lysozyme
MNKLVDSIKINEGFRGDVYKDHLGFDTVGFGTKMPLDEDEAELLLTHRLKKKIKEIEAKEPYINKLPLEKQEIVIEMAYQMGVTGVMNFKNMWVALKENDYKTAGAEMLDSLWAKQTPNRAKELSDKMSYVS